MSVSNTENRKIVIDLDAAPATESLSHLRGELRKLKSAQNKLDIGSPAFKELGKTIDETSAKIKHASATATKAKSSFMDMAKGFLAAGVIAGLTQKIIHFGVESLRAFGEAEANANGLKFALVNMSHEGSDALDRLLAQSSALQEQGIFDDDSIQISQKAMVQFGLTSKQVEKLIPLVTDLAAAQGEDLATATDKALKAIDGSTKGLGNAGIAFEDTGTWAGNLSVLTEKLTKFQGANADAAEDLIGKYARLRNAWGDFTEDIGEFLVNQGTSILDWFDELTGKTTMLDAKLKRTIAETNKKAFETLFSEQEEFARKSEANRLKAIQDNLDRIAVIKQKGLATDDINVKMGLVAELKARDKLHIQLQNLNKKHEDTLSAAGRAALEKRSQDAGNAFKKQIADYKKRAEELYKQERDEIIKTGEEKIKADAKYLDEKHSIEDQIYLLSLDEKNKEVVLEAQKFDEIIVAAEQHGIDVTELRELQARAILAIIDKQNAEELKKTKEGEDAKSKEVKDAEEKKKQIRLKAAEEIGNSVSEIVGNYGAIQSNIEQQYLNEFFSIVDAKQKKNDAALAGDLITQKEHDRRDLQFQKEKDKEEAKIKKQQYERDQKLAVSKALISGFVGVAKIWETWAALPIIAAALSIAEGVVVGTQVAAIKTAPKPYALGGYTDERSNPQGFTNGATLYTNSASGNDFIAGEAGTEWIASNWMTTNPLTANIIGMLDNIQRTKQMPTAPLEMSKAGGKNNGNDQLTASIIKLNAILENGLPAYIDYDGYTRTMNGINNAKKSASIG